MRKQFKDSCLELAEKNERISLIFGDLSVFLFREFSERYPDRFYNLGIMEQSMVTVAAGMASVGQIPFVHSITPFLVERSYEQIKLDICYNKTAVKLVSIGASYDYAWDGPTHHCYGDIEILRLLPSMEVIQPGSSYELKQLIDQTYDNGNPTYYRLSDHEHDIEIKVEFGKGQILKSAQSQNTVITAGPILRNVVDACKDLDLNILYFPTIKPLDTELLSQFKDHNLMVIHEAYGLLEAAQSAFPASRFAARTMRDSFVNSYGNLEQIRGDLGFDARSLREFLTQNMIS